MLVQSFTSAYENIFLSMFQKHDVPLAAIPCLHQKSGLAREHAQAESLNAEKSRSSTNTPSNNGASILNTLNMSGMNTNEGTPNDGCNAKHISVDKEYEKNGLDVVMSLADTSGVTHRIGMTVTGGVQVINLDTETEVLPENDSVTDSGGVTQQPENTRNSNASRKQDSSGKQTSSEFEKSVVEGSHSSNPPLLESVGARELGVYLSNIWEFQPLTSDQEKNAVIFQPQVLDDLQLPASLECQPYAVKGTENGKQSGKDLALNPGGKTPVAILHEYCQRALKTKPLYLSSECESADTPFMAEVQVDGIKYGSGIGANKKVAKQIAAESALEVLLPGVFSKVRDYQISEAELEVGAKLQGVSIILVFACNLHVTLYTNCVQKHNCFLCWMHEKY